MGDAGHHEKCSFSNSSGIVVKTFVQTNAFKPCLAVIAVATLGILGNILATCTITKKKFKQLSFSVYIRMLTIADSLALLMSAAPLLLEWIYAESTQEVFGVAGYLSFHFVSQTAQMVSSWLMVAISVDRFIVVVYPLRRFQMCTRKRAMSTSIGIILASGALICAEILTGVLQPGECMKDFSEMSEFSAMTKMRRLVMTLIVPGTVCIGFNVKVIVVIRKMNSFRKQLSACPAHLSTTHRPNGQEKISRALALVSALSAILFIPVIVLDIMDAVYMERHLQGEESIELITSRWCISDLIYITDISLHFYTLIGILYGYTLKCLTQISLMKHRVLGWAPNAKPATSANCYNIQLQMFINNNNNDSASSSPRFQRITSDKERLPKDLT